MIDASRRYTAQVHTTRGDFTVELLPSLAPEHVNSFVFLARDEFYNGTVFHRIVPGFVAQGGDPTGTGTGGPGYTFEDEFNQHKVERGVLAMANAGPNTNGSQFFIVVAEAAPWLDGKHTVFGRVTSGMDVVDTIVDLPRDARDKPAEDVTIERVSVA
jgi:peptidyl-prolyl cis-trans isomerase B (cyclophilin B)